MKSKSTNSKLRLGVIFGGISPEHEISIMSAMQLIEAIDTEKYVIVPIYISISGEWYTGEDLFYLNNFKNLKETLNKSREIVLIPKPKGPKFFYLKKSNGKLMMEESNDLVIDIAFLSLHGTHGEDGAIQGLLKMAKIPFVGSGLRSSALTMNKWTAKLIAESLGIPTLSSIIGKKSDFMEDFDQAWQDLLKLKIKFPVIIKPTNLGSSVGLNFADNEEQLKVAMIEVFKVDDEAIIEPRVVDLTEINVSVFGIRNPRASVIEVPLSEKELLTYEKKYMSGTGGKKGNKSQSSGMANLQREVNSIKISEELKEEAREMATKLFSNMNCGGVVRIDFIYDNQAKKLYFNELNSIPGSFSYYLWVASKPRWLLTELIDFLVAESLEEFGITATLSQTQPFRALR